MWSEYIGASLATQNCGHVICASAEQYTLLNLLSRSGYWYHCIMSHYRTAHHYPPLALLCKSFLMCYVVAHGNSLVRGTSHFQQACGIWLKQLHTAWLFGAATHWLCGASLPIAWNFARALVAMQTLAQCIHSCRAAPHPGVAICDAFAHNCAFV